MGLVDLRELSYPDLREKVAKQWNGIYAIQICKKCKRYLSNPEGDLRTAKIVDCCKECFEQKVIG